MMKTSASVLTLCIAALVGGWAFAQEDEERREALETIEQLRMQAKSLAESLPADFSELMAVAMEHNPELRRGRAAVEMAQADLDGAQAELTSQLRGLHARLAALVRALEEMPEALQSPKGTAGRPPVGAGMYIHNANSALEAIAETHGEIRKLIGGERWDRPNRVAGSAPMGGFAALAQMRIPQPRPAYEEGTPENLKEILEQRVSNITFEDISVTEIFGFLSDMYEINVTTDLAFPPPTIRQIELWKLPLHDVFLALSDQMGDACFVIRDYGLFLTTRERAQTLAGVTIPEDVPYLAPVPLQGGFGGGGGGFGGGGGGFGFGVGFGGGGGGFGGGGVGAFGGGGGGGSAGPGSAPGEAPAAPQEPSN